MLGVVNSCRVADAYKLYAAIQKSYWSLFDIRATSV